MKTTRRAFLKIGATAVAGTAAWSESLLAFGKESAVLGVQLYSVREQISADPLGTLQKVAAIGYKYVEHASYRDRKFYGYPAGEFRKILDDLGINMLSGHTRFGMDHWDAARKTFTDTWKYTVEDAATLGQKTVINPWMDEPIRKDSDQLKRYLELFNRSGELCKQHGMMFGYHNHNFEFDTMVDGKPLYDVILSNTDPELVVQQLDMGNCLSGGGHALDILKKNPGRFLSMHVKDEIKSETEAEGYESAVLGTGLIDVKEVIDYAKKKGGTAHFIVEQESYQGRTPLESIGMDYTQMKKWGY